MSRNTPPDGLELDALLARVAGEYEVDRALLRSRLQQAGAGRGRPVPAAARPRRGGAGGPLIAAAAVMAVLLGVGTLVRLDVWNPRPDPTTAATADPTTGPATRSAAPSPLPTATATGRITGTPSAGGRPAPSGGVTASGTGAPAAPSGTGRRPTPRGSAPARTSGPTAGGRSPSAPTRGADPVGRSVSLATAALPGRLSFGEQGWDDWVVVGGRRDGKQIRLKRGSGGVSVSDLVGAAQVRQAPFTLSWSGGAPEQDREGVRTWWCAGNGGSGDAAVLGATVRGVVGGDVVTLVVGAEGQGPVKVEARLRGGDLAQVRTSGGLVRVAVPSNPVGGDLFLELTPASGGGLACLAAVALG